MESRLLWDKDLRRLCFFHSLLLTLHRKTYTFTHTHICSYTYTSYAHTHHTFMPTYLTHLNTHIHSPAAHHMVSSLTITSPMKASLLSTEQSQPPPMCPLPSACPSKPSHPAPQLLGVSPVTVSSPDLQTCAFTRVLRTPPSDQPQETNDACLMDN